MSDKPAIIGSDKQAQQLRDLIARGKEQGYLTYSEVNDHLPNDIVGPEQIEDIVNMINDMGIAVHEKAPDAESLLLSDTTVTNDDDAAEEAEAALVNVDAEFGRTTDPVRMYMREMGTVELLTRQGEIDIAKRMEDGLKQVKYHMAHFPPTMEKLLISLISIMTRCEEISQSVRQFEHRHIQELTHQAEFFQCVYQFPLHRLSCRWESVKTVQLLVSIFTMNGQPS